MTDRVAQTVAAMALERRTGSIFHPDSYGYRSRRSALDAVARCRQRCWRKDWVIDLDVAKFFDSVPWDLMVKAVEANITADQRWVLLYVKRWLQAPLALPNGTLHERDRGTPQGSAISPVLANLFMHYAFDTFLAREFPDVEFERYADDAVVHCVTEQRARQVLEALSERMEEVGLRLHPTKTKVVYCKDKVRPSSYEDTEFTFLGFTFLPPARSATWRIHGRTRLDLNELAAAINPIVAGWMNYYGRFYRSQLHPFLTRINTYLMRWARKNYKRLRSFKRFRAWWLGIVERAPRLFAHWRWTAETGGMR